MRNFTLPTILCIAVAGLHSTLKHVSAASQVNNISDVRLGMETADAISGLRGKYTVVEGGSEQDGLRSYGVSGGGDRKFDYEIMSLNGKVASIWTNDSANPYQGES